MRLPIGRSDWPISTSMAISGRPSNAASSRPASRSARVLRARSAPKNRLPATTPSSQNMATARICSASLAVSATLMLRLRRMSIITSRPKVTSGPGSTRASQSNRVKGIKGRPGHCCPRESSPSNGAVNKKPASAPRPKAGLSVMPTGIARAVPDVRGRDDKPAQTRRKQARGSCLDPIVPSELPYANDRAAPGQASHRDLTRRSGSAGSRCHGCFRAVGCADKCVPCLRVQRFCRP